MFLTFLWCFFLILASINAYRPVILMHGVNPSYSELPEMAEIIQKAHPGTNVTIIDDFSTTISSFCPMWQQVNTIKVKVERIMKENPGGVHMLCFSQGGLVCRGMLHAMPNHNCQSFIALSSPLAGQFGDTDYLRYFFPTMLKKKLYKVFYTKFFQNEFSVANYWNDPHHQELYRKYSNFLAVINNQTSSPDSYAYKKNFVRIKRLVAIGGPDDGVITPWQSSQFGVYDSSEKVRPYIQQEWYVKDWFGLRTLVERNAYHTYTVPGIKHTHWPRNRTVFQRYILPWLD